MDYTNPKRLTLQGKLNPYLDNLTEPEMMIFLYLELIFYSISLITPC